MKHAELQRVPIVLNALLQHVSLWQGYSYETQRDNDIDSEDLHNVSHAGNRDIKYAGCFPTHSILLCLTNVLHCMKLHMGEMTVHSF